MSQATEFHLSTAEQPFLLEFLVIPVIMKKITNYRILEYLTKVGNLIIITMDNKNSKIL